MAFDFPTTPSVGTIYTPAGGPSYRWDGEKWQFVGDAALYRQKTALARNFLVNPVMAVSQENGDTEGVSVSNYFMADQWYGSLVSTGTLLGGRGFGGSRTPRGSVYRIRARVGTADTALAAGEFAQPFIQLIEGTEIAGFGWGTPYAIPIVIRFGFRGPAGTYMAVIRDTGSVSASFVHPFTITPAQANTDIEVVFAVPAPAIGTWPVDNGKGMNFGICVGAGSTLFSPTPDAWAAGNFIGVAGMSNGMAVSGNLFYLFDAGLYADPDNTGLPPPFEVPDATDELLRCCRYYWKGLPSNALNYNSYAVGGLASWACSFPVPMRTVPTMSIDNSGTVTSNSNMPTAGPTSINNGFRLSASATAISTNANISFGSGSAITASARM